MGVLNLNLGAAYVKHDERAVAFEHLERARDLFAQAKSRDLLPELHRRLAEAHQAQKELAEARREAETSLALAEELSMLGEQGLTRRTLGNIAAEDGRTDDAERDLQLSLIHIYISGFTPLTAALAQELGVQRGAEEVLNLSLIHI